MRDSVTRTAQDVCRGVYEETRTFYAEKAPSLGDAAYGFRILYGPPTTNAPILFLGYQPGGTTQNTDEHYGWPPRSEYAFAPWTLAARLRRIWGGPMLEGCTGLNAIFFRAPTIRAWKRHPYNLRNELERFSRTRAERITRALSPRSIVIVGLGTFDSLTDGVVDLRHDQRVLVKRGQLWGAPVSGIVHISGARVSRSDRALLKTYFIGPNQPGGGSVKEVVS
jgi:hypothetical protein